MAYLSSFNKLIYDNAVLIHNIIYNKRKYTNRKRIINDLV